MQANFLIVFTALAALAYADNMGCPHPNEARNLLLEKLVIASAPNDGRHVEEVEIPREIIGRSDLSCIAVYANRAGSTPDFISFGRNKLQGYSIILHSRLRNPMNATLFIYSM